MMHGTMNVKISYLLYTYCTSYSPFAILIFYVKLVKQKHLSDGAVPNVELPPL
jgi:hypothetical protein